MIPTIEEIVEGLIGKSITASQAIGWLHIHAEDAGRTLLDDFAAAAMQGFSSSLSESVVTAMAEGTLGGARVSKAAYVLARAMLEERQKHTFR